MRSFALSCVCVALSAPAVVAQPGRPFTPPPPPPPVPTFTPPPRIQTFTPPTQTFNVNNGIRAGQDASQRAQQLQNTFRANDVATQQFRYSQDSMRQVQAMGDRERG